MAEQALHAFVLHRRPWRETSLLLELLTAEHGRLGAVARGATGQRATWRHCLQAFRPLTVFISGKGELATVRSAEERQAWPPLVGERLYCGLYLNELLMRLLARNDAHPVLFQAYHDTIMVLNDVTHLGVPLRYFELTLLAELGFGLQLECEADSGQMVDAATHYHYDIEAGPRPTTNRNRGYAGESLLALAKRDLTSARQRIDARRLLQQALAPHLGPRPLMSRQLMNRRNV